MKKLILISALFLLTVITFGQVLPKGTLIGTHAITITLQPGVTMEQYLQFLSSKYIPEFNKMDPNWQVYLVKSVRGNISTNSIGAIHVIKTEKDREKYYTADGGSSELGKSRTAKLKPVQDELNKLGSMATTWTDWVVQ